MLEILKILTSSRHELAGCTICQKFCWFFFSAEVNFHIRTLGIWTAFEKYYVTAYNMDGKRLLKIVRLTL